MILLLEQSVYLRCPCFNFCFCRFQMVAAGGVKFHLHIVSNLGARAGGSNIHQHMARLSTMGLKRHNNFSAPVLLVQKCKNCGSHGVPPGRRANGDYIIVPNINIQRFDLRLVTALYFLLALLNYIIIAAGIGHHRLDLHHVRSGSLLERLGNPFCVAV